jgi:hypothetical protein
LRLGEVVDPALAGANTGADPMGEDEARTAQVMRMMNDIPDSDEERELLGNRPSANGDESDEIDYDEYFSSLAQTHKNLKKSDAEKAAEAAAPVRKQMQVVDDDEDDDALFNSLVSQHLI